MSSSGDRLVTPRTVCTTCGAMVGVEYHPHAFCVLVKAGLDPGEVVHAAVRWYDKHGWPEAKPNG